MSHRPTQRVIAIPPMGNTYLHDPIDVTIGNDSLTQTLYVRVGLKSFKVSYRKPAAYGTGKRASN